MNNNSSLSMDVVDLKKRLNRLENRIMLYQKTINRIDDYFEYRYESKADQAHVQEYLAWLTEQLQMQEK